MNPLTLLREVLAPKPQNSSGTVVGTQGKLTLVRTAMGIKAIAAPELTRGETVLMDSAGKVLSSHSTETSIPTYRV